LGAEQCLKAVKPLTNDIGDAIIDHAGDLIEGFIDKQLLPVELIYKVWGKVKLKIQQDPDPKIYWLKNPGPAVWNGESYIMPIVDNTTVLPRDHHVYLFVHGIENQGINDAFEFYKSFEKEAKMFYLEDDRRSFKEIFIVSYNVKMSEEIKNTILDGFAKVVEDIVIGQGPLMLAAVFWKELERRAIKTGNILIPFLSKMLENYNTGYVITHSLGSYVMAHAAHQAIRSNPNVLKLFNVWLAIAPAVPCNAFANPNDGDNFSLAPGICETYYEGSRYENQFGMKIFYSSNDIVLNTAYTLAKGYPAMGSIGAYARGRIYPFKNINVTRQVGTTHQTSGDNGYFHLIGPRIRLILGTIIEGAIDNKLENMCLYENKENCKSSPILN